MNNEGNTGVEKELCSTCHSEWDSERGKICSNGFHLAAPWLMKKMIDREAKYIAALKECVEILEGIKYESIVSHSQKEIDSAIERAKAILTPLEPASPPVSKPPESK